MIYDLKRNYNKIEENTMTSGKLSTSDFSDPISSEDLSEPTRAKEFLGNTLLNQYTLVEYIGHGAMGLVYKAFHKHLDKHVAVKLIRADINSNPKYLVRFQREAIALGRLNHPNILTTMDFGIITGGVPFLVTELIEGQTLKDLLKSDSFTELNKVISLMRQITKGLSYAHSKGIIHRDIKPSNIIIENWEEAEFTAKIVDFGLAKLDEKDLSLTAPGTGIGTPLYMSPEQCYGHEIDDRSDLYSLACLMFEVISGKPPFKGSSTLETISMHKESAVPSLSSNHFEVPNYLDKAIMKCLEKEPQKRFSSAQELLSNIEPEPAPEVIEMEATKNSFNPDVTPPSHSKWFHFLLIPSTLILCGFLVFNLIKNLDIKPDNQPKKNHSSLNEDLKKDKLPPTTPMPKRAKNEISTANVFNDIKFVKIKGWWKPGIPEPSILDTRELENLYKRSGNSVKKLNLDFCRSINDTSIEAINKFPLDSLKISNTGITSAGIRKLKALKKLRWLDVSGLPLTNKLEELDDFPALKTLIARNSLLTEKDYQTISGIKRIHFLDLSNPKNKIGAREIRILESLPNLRYLIITNTENLSPGAIKAISNIRSIHLLDLKGAGNIGAEEIEHLSKMKLQSITLTLSHTAFKSLLKFPSFKEVNVQVETKGLTKEERRNLKESWPELYLI